MIDQRSNESSYNEDISEFENLAKTLVRNSSSVTRQESTSKHDLKSKSSLKQLNTKQSRQKLRSLSRIDLLLTKKQERRPSMQLKTL